MWLDRFSNNSTPSGSSPSTRPYSPLPRKQSHLGQSRNGVNFTAPAARSTSSLDLSGNSSDVSLPLSSARAAVTNGSSLKQEQKPPEDVQEPTEVLNDILSEFHGKPRAKRRASGTKNPTSSELAASIDFGGLSLDAYADERTHAKGTPLQRVDPQVRRQTYKDFRDSIAQCDDVLNTVESYLSDFKVELGQVSTEIESLQARSLQLNAQLDNRRKVEKLLGPAVEELSISPSTVKAIADGPIDENFGKGLSEVEARWLSLTTKHKEDEVNRAIEDIKPLLEDLKNRAVERIRDYLVAQIKALRSPNINAQIIQQQTFLKHRELFPFLSRNHSVLAEEISQAYVNTARWYFSSNFARYHSALRKLQLHDFDQSDLLGSDPAISKRNMLGAAKATQPQHDAFNLGRRADILRAKTSAALPMHVAEDSKSSHDMETPFRSFTQALLDNVTAEYAFATEFFSSHSYHQVARIVNEIFEPTFTLGHTLTRNLVEDSTDCLGILTCVRLNQHFAFQAQRRKVPALDAYLNYTNILLWPRFQKVMDLHCESLKKVSMVFNRSATAAFNLVGGTDTAKSSTAPHAVTQRFGQFLQGILALSPEGGDDEPVANSLARLRAEFDACMSRLAKGAGDSTKRSRFMYNNYSLVLTIIGDTQGKLAEEHKEHFSTLVKDNQRK